MEDDATAEDAESKVFGVDDLLTEILLRVGFPTTLVRAASVCKRWLHHASDKAFLRRFRKLNPPRILGFYIKGFQGSPRFVPMLPQPRELAAAVRIVEGYSFGAGNDMVLPQDCRNGSVFTVLFCSRGGIGVVHSPLCPERAMTIDPPLSPQQRLQQYQNHSWQLIRLPRIFRILSREENDGDLSYFNVLMEFPMEEEATKFMVEVSTLQDGVWCTHISATTQIPGSTGRLRAVLVDNKIYMTVTLIDITVLDLTTSTFSTIQLPPGVHYRSSDFMLSQADDASGVYLIEMKQLQLRIWLYKGGNWSTVDTISLHEMCANVMMSDWTVTSRLWITYVGDNAEFVLLDSGRFLLYLDVRCRTLRTFYEMSEDERKIRCINVHPFMMIWPPTFPALKYDSTRNAM